MYFDIQTMGKECFEAGIREVLESPNIMKVSNITVMGEVPVTCSIAVFIYYTEYKFMCLLRWVRCSVAVYQSACTCSRGFKFYSVFNILAYRLGLFQCVSCPLFLLSP